MELLVEGKGTLQGEVEISTSKNAILPILIAALLSEEEVCIHRVPEINDVEIVKKLLKNLGASVSKSQGQLSVKSFISNIFPDYELVRQIRASLLLMGPILATRKTVKISLPGGCAIGTRPIDLHLKGFEALGARIKLSGGNVIAQARELQGNHIYLDFPSVGATENLMMAAALAQGTTFIENAALEPEVVDLANFINRMGGSIHRAGSNLIKIEGRKRLHGCTYTPIPDRIEAGTYMVAAAATGGNLLINNVIPEHVKATSAKLVESGAKVEERDKSIRVERLGPIKPIYIKTLPYPGFPTDMQAQFMAYLSHTSGSSVITESVFENRFMHAQELMRMGANIKIEGRTAIVKGVGCLGGAQVKATDLRAGAALLIAGLMAEGTTCIANSHHIDRGYENIVEKLNGAGAKIHRG
ncbi:MAG: UDP-N-acetylglucosamine 1-carboxyvinyltransferase [Syntrophomonadaceae bacterium]|jgi:UDP-N-acetylglucosamine 1-carboxyvinyltransferase|nr:UDP-N-acetylglucosamine 1-carboxyvinyltransferase [Syntrophomonadaceae bacterium]